MAHDHAHGSAHAHDHAPKDFGTAFAVGIGLNLAFVATEAVYGYIAHFLEFRRDSRLIRPRALYTGPAVGSRSKSAA